ncbi:acetylserotonin O-methyltransferase-like [Glandiceps talaboti]
MAENGAEAIEILAHVHSYAVTQALVAACHLRLFDHIENKGLTAQQVVDAIHADAVATQELLNALMSLGYVEKIEGTNYAKPIYRNTSLASKYLVTTSTESLYPYIMIQGQVAYPVQSNFKHAVQEGQSQVGRTFQGQTFSDIINKDAKKAMGFYASKHALSRVFNTPVVLDCFDLSSYREACDLGGGSGTVGLALAQTYPTMTVNVFDRPAAIDAAHKFILESSIPGNLVFETGDPMKDSLPYCDLYILSHIINVMTDDAAAFLLKKVFATMVPGGAILLLEKLFDDDKQGPYFTHMFSLSSLAFNGTRQRSCEEVRKLLERQGFREVEVKRTGSLSDAILAKRPMIP